MEDIRVSPNRPMNPQTVYNYLENPLNGSSVPNPRFVLNPGCVGK